jgi:hypothetical protein
MGRLFGGVITSAAVLVLVVPIMAVITAATSSGVLPFTGSPALLILSVAAALIVVALAVGLLLTAAFLVYFLV